MATRNATTKIGETARIHGALVKRLIATGCTSSTWATTARKGGA